jgi:hypothetical protein
MEGGEDLIDGSRSASGATRITREISEEEEKLDASYLP